MFLLNSTMFMMYEAIHTYTEWVPFPFSLLCKRYPVREMWLHVKCGWDKPIWTFPFKRCCSIAAPFSEKCPFFSKCIAFVQGLAITTNHDTGNHSIIHCWSMKPGVLVLCRHDVVLCRQELSRHKFQRLGQKTPNYLLNVPSKKGKVQLGVDCLLCINLRRVT